MTTTRIGYVLTCNPQSNRAQFSKNVLEKVGFSVSFIQCIPNEDKVVSNKQSMLSIYDSIIKGEDEWAYVFEDDINVLEDIRLDEIIQYENISTRLFYLGACLYANEASNPQFSIHPTKINGHNVTIVNTNVRGLHAIALSKSGAAELIAFSQNYPNYKYMDMILEEFAKRHPATIVRYDLESYIPGHLGAFFQDRKLFPSSIPDPVPPPLTETVMRPFGLTRRRPVKRFLMSLL